jgi:poly(beta-D-mannuronate) lyase
MLRLSLRTAGWLIVGFMLGMASAQAREVLASSPTELRAALKAPAPGDVIVLRDGDWPDSEIRFRGEGTPDRPITLRAQTVGGAKLTGQSWIRMFGRHLVVEGLAFERGYSEGADVIQFREDSDEPAEQCRVTRCSIVNFNPPAGDDTSCRWVRFDGVSNRLDHCYFEGKSNYGNTVCVELRERPNYHRIDHNHFGPRPPLGRNGGETIRIGDSEHSMQNSRTIVEDNLFEECDGEVEIISSKSCENLFRRNTFRKCDGTLTLRHGNRNRVEANWFLGGGKSGAGGVRVIGEGHRVINNYFSELPGDALRGAICVMAGDKNAKLSGYGPVEGGVIAFNTIIECKQPIVVGERYRKAVVAPTDVQVIGNLIYNKRKGAEVKLEEAGEGLRVEANVCFGKVKLEARQGLAEEEMVKLAAWKGDALRLTRAFSASFVQDKPITTVDIEGESRSGVYHAGCDQFSEFQGANWPLTKNDVGPGADR